MKQNKIWYSSLSSSSREKKIGSQNENRMHEYMNSTISLAVCYTNEKWHIIEIGQSKRCGQHQYCILTTDNDSIK